MGKRKPPYFVESAPRPDGVLSMVRVEPGWCVLSTGELLLIRYDKLQALAEQVTQEQCPIWIRTWTSRDGEELVDLHRHGVMRTGSFTDTTLTEETF